MWRAVEALLDEGLREGLFAGCGLCVRVEDAVLFESERGLAEIAPRRRPVAPGQPFDLASVTKVLGAVPVAMDLVARGALDLDAPLRRWLHDAPEGVSARHCLQHASGLPAWRPLYELVLQRSMAWGAASTREFVLREARTEAVIAPPGARHQYSDLGFLLLCAALEAAGGARLDRLWSGATARSGADLRWGWPGAAATELCPVRGGLVVGTVHDLNAAVLGGISSHAGLFGAASDTAAAAAWQLRAWHGEAGEGLDPEVVRHFWSAQGPGSHRLGWDGVSPGASSAGDRWPLDGVGHLGFTGTSVWIAPRQRVVVAFLTNRVHPLVEGGSVAGAPDSPRYRSFRALRPRLHTAIVEVLAGLGRWAS